MKQMSAESSIFVAGARGMVGSAVIRELKKQSFQNILAPVRKDLDLLYQSAVNQFFEKNKPEYVFLAAAKVGGIHANNTYPADFGWENLVIATNVIKAAHDFKTTKLLFLGSSCIYPKMAEQPIREDSLLTGPLEPTNEAYAIAKIAGLKMCTYFNKQYGDRFISAMPTNLYGENDNYHPENSHVIPGMMRRFHEAKISQQKEVMVWGSGKPRREFLNVEDLAIALVHLMKNYESPETVNVGTGEDLEIRELALLMKEVVGFKGEIRFDSSKPDGTPRKILDVSKIHSLGWKHKIGLREGLTQVYAQALEKKVFENASSSLA